jgi:queuine tRNA-ribosyltransferase
LFVAGELLFHRLASLHNIRFYLSLMTGARQAIEEQRFAAFLATTRAALAGAPEEG